VYVKYAPSLRFGRARNLVSRRSLSLGVEMNDPG